MQLRSGTSIASGSTATTKASTQASGTQAKGKLSVIIEDYSSRSSKTSSQTTSEASAFMEGFANMNLNAGFPTVDAALLGYDTRLIFVRENRFGAKLYSDHFNRIAVKIEDIPTPTEAEVWVRSQGDQYMSIMGICYLLTLEYENMDMHGKLHVQPHVCTFSKPMYGMPSWSMGVDSPSREKAPSAPPMTGTEWTKHNEAEKEEVSFSFPPATPDRKEIELYKLYVRKVKNDSEFVALYVSLSRIVFKTMMVYGFPYPPDQELHVYRDDETLSIDFRDEWGNKYYVIEGDGLQDFTRMGVPIFTRKSATSSRSKTITIFHNSTR